MYSEIALMYDTLYLLPLGSGDLIDRERQRATQIDMDPSGDGQWQTCTNTQVL